MQHWCMNSSTRTFKLCNNELSGWKIESGVQLFQLLICFSRPLQVCEVEDPDGKILDGEPVHCEESVKGTTVLTKQPVEILFGEDELLWKKEMLLYFQTAGVNVTMRTDEKGLYISPAVLQPTRIRLK